MKTCPVQQYIVKLNLEIQISEKFLKVNDFSKIESSQLTVHCKKAIFTFFSIERVVHQEQKPATLVVGFVRA